MVKIVFIGLREDDFIKLIIGDCLLVPCLADAEFAIVNENASFDSNKAALYFNLLQKLNNDINHGRAVIRIYEDRRRALYGADYVITLGNRSISSYIESDYKIPMKYGLEQTYADTVGIGGIFRGLRVIPKMIEIANDIMEICPDAWLLNYIDPMSIVIGALSRTGVKVIGLCHSVQSCAKNLLCGLGMDTENILWKIAGINHQAWLLEITQNGHDIYPQIKERALKRPKPHNDMINYDIMEKFGYYVTESSNHHSEYLPYYIKRSFPELISRFCLRTNLYLDIDDLNHEFWQDTRAKLSSSDKLSHFRSYDYSSCIIESMETNSLYKINANVINNDLITNLPREAIVEVPCMMDGGGITPGYVGNLPPQLAALNRLNINVYLLTIEAALTHKREHIYHAALLDPHTSAELPADIIIKMCDELIIMNQPWLWDYE